ncbi:MAG: type VI secretion system baseplate subunit TssE [Candidatus Electrothrix sp. AR4]|nr:type VI secretion system baseplate subunit TssE [Candidatus Electrothrix sp. AR4]
MLRERLLERIARLNQEEKEGTREQTAAADETRSILQHLARLLNTRQGSVSILPDYGVPDMTNVPGDSIEEIRQNVEQILQKVVRKYEPRLAKVRMIMDQGEKHSFALRFRIEAILADQEDIPVIFETVVSTDGHVGITG